MKLDMLINFVSPSVYDYIADSTTYDIAIEVLTSLNVKPKNEIFARHQLACRKQQTNESIDDFLQALRKLAKDCNFEPVSAEQYSSESIREAFISGLNSSIIRQRLLENRTLSLDDAFQQGRSLDIAQKNSEEYVQPRFANAISETLHTDDTSLKYTSAAVQQSSQKQSCYFCGNPRHPRYICPAKDAICSKCQRKGHFCQSKKSITAAVHPDNNSHQLESPTLATISAGTLSALSQAIKDVTINGNNIASLIDTGSTESFISIHIL